MIKTLLKTGFYCSVQILLLMTVSATTQGIDIEELPAVHEASGVLNIEGEAGINDVRSCMSVIHQALEILPEDHVDTLSDLTLVFEEDAKRGQAGGDMMRLRCVDMSEDELVAVLVHEMGHIVDTGMLQSEKYADSSDGFWDGDKPVYSDDLSASFYGISWDSNIEYSNGTDQYSFVSKYASTDPFEDFAETYLMYVLHGESFLKMAESNDDLAEKYNFMRDYVFDGVEYGDVDLYSSDPYARVYDATLLEFDLEKLFS